MTTPPIVSDSNEQRGPMNTTRLIRRPEKIQISTTSSLITQSKKVWLVGLMACGKSSIGSEIAKILDATTVDMDKLIVQQQKISIAEIFAQIQEEGFRQLEKQLVGELAHHQDDLVIATGGGAPCFHGNMETMNRSGVTVFLDASPELVAQRTMADEEAGKPIRPLVASRSLEERIAIFQQQQAVRGKFYGEAKITIQVDGLGIEEIVARILKHDSMKGFSA